MEQKQRDPMELGARLVRGSLRRTRVFRDNEYLYERYRIGGNDKPLSAAGAEHNQPDM